MEKIFQISHNGCVKNLQFNLKSFQLQIIQLKQELQQMVKTYIYKSFGLNTEVEEQLKEFNMLEQTKQDQIQMP